ncbi:pentapeptide repeat-containing protein [Streptomyces phaeoluteigriseus]|uniref:Pentapeptide repeat-containing protein n=1 Tax=Streptomyces phaeoluteigriseus TaxID=114686 RepID=A0ABY4Z018_9ACTN|nr:pentapeptide repeat-containing protein [Streptomyces phaeoluteigriseus]USQ82372.1 pentapeptide repeat-containing protein [Streptomyces phaeoluteigriseus]
MDFTSWGDWVRMCLGAVVSYPLLMAGWWAVARAAAFSDPHRLAGRRVAFVPRRAVRPRTEVLRRRLRAALALRRHQGVVSSVPADELLRRLVEADRSARVLAAGRRMWCLAVPFTLLAGAVLLGTWLLVFEYVMAGPFAEINGPYAYLGKIFGTDGWHIPDSETCSSWSVLSGCDPDVRPWWYGVESGLLFGLAPASLVAAWRIRQAASRSFALWARQEPPLIACLDVLTACRDALRPAPPAATVLDERMAALTAALRDFSREGLPLAQDRRAELEAHTARVTETLGEATGGHLRDGTTALPALVGLLATLQDRLHASRWFLLLDPAQLTTAPGPAPVPAPTTPVPANAPSIDAGRWQRYMWVATAMPAVPALLALVFTAMTISQANQNLGLTERNQVASTYNETVANLGDESINVRVSSIYALRRIMRESRSEQPAIVSILSTYIRDHAKMPGTAAAERLRKSDKTRAPDDVQAALEVLGGRAEDLEGEPKIDLRDTFLVGATFYGTFDNADLRGADLTRADLQGARFELAWFDNARMNDAYLSDGDFEDADFLETDMTGAWLDGAILHDADLTQAKLVGVHGNYEGSFAQFTDADLTAADLTNADLRGVNLVHADLGQEVAQGLPAATVTDTILIDADLTDALLDGVDTDAALWEEADLAEKASAQGD